MSIPKIIHYCWFGGGPISAESQKCMESWKKYCPDYKIIEWNDQNFDISTNRYAQQAYEANKYAFVSDYVRLAVLYEYGGIYGAGAPAGRAAGAARVYGVSDQ